MSEAVELAQLFADVFLVGFVGYWLWRRFGRSLRESLPPARKSSGRPGSAPEREKSAASAANPIEGERIRRRD